MHLPALDRRSRATRQQPKQGGPSLGQTRVPYQAGRDDGRVPDEPRGIPGPGRSPRRLLRRWPGHICARRPALSSGHRRDAARRMGHPPRNWIATPGLPVIIRAVGQPASHIRCSHILRIRPGHTNTSVTPASTNAGPATGLRQPGSGVSPPLRQFHVRRHDCFHPPIEASVSDTCLDGTQAPQLDPAEPGT
jgi:hypothetical protein